MAKQKTYIIANWKMNPLSLSEAKKLFTGIKKEGNKAKGVQTVVCPPHLFVSDLQKQVTGHRVVIGGQDAFAERTGAFTGQVSAAQMKKIGAQYVVLGHSERRARGETYEEINKKIKAALKEKLMPVVCIGEHKRDEGGAYLRVIEDQIKEAISGIADKDFERLIIAYEPIWAISSNKKAKADSPEDAEETVLYIRKVLASMTSRKRAMNVPVLYGGSTNPNNAQGFLERGGVQGLLVGSASLNAKSFGEMIRIADAIKSKK